MPKPPVPTPENFKIELQRFMLKRGVGVGIEPKAITVTRTGEAGTEFFTVEYGSLTTGPLSGILHLPHLNRPSPLQSLLRADGPLAQVIARTGIRNELFRAYHHYQGIADNAVKEAEQVKLLVGNASDTDVGVALEAQANGYGVEARREDSRSTSADLLFRAGVLLSTSPLSRHIGMAADRFMEAGTLAMGHDARALIMGVSADTARKNVSKVERDTATWTWEFYIDREIASWRKSLHPTPDPISDLIRIFQGMRRWIGRPHLPKNMHRFTERARRLNQDRNLHNGIANDHIRMGWAELHANGHQATNYKVWEEVSQHLSFAGRIWKDLPARTHYRDELMHFAQAAESLAVRDH